MTPRSRWVLTDHAIDRYIARIDPTATRDDVRRHVADVSRRAHLVGTRDGASLYRDPDHPMRAEYVVAPRRVLATVYDPTVQANTHGREMAR